MQMRFLLILLLLCSASAATDKKAGEKFFFPHENVALGGFAVQSSDYTSSYPAKKAIDGNRNAIFSQMFCSCTAYQVNPWWRVNLPEVFAVVNVVITNTEESYSKSINGAEVRIGNSLDNNGNNNPRCAVVTSIPAGGSTTFHCYGMKGRYINIFLPRTDYLILCEVEVYGYLSPENVALRGQATQSTQFEIGDADKAIDGNRHAVFGDGSCSHTKPQNNPWWKVDLLEVYRVTSVIITNRGDQGSERINGAEIRIGNSPQNNGNNNPVCVVVSTISAGASVTYQCHGMMGRFINIIIPGNNKVLTLCELEVYASPVYV